MWRTFTYVISILLLMSCSEFLVRAQDTIPIPLKIKIGFEVSGPVSHHFNKKISNTEGYLSVDLNEKRSAFFSAGYSNFSYSQYNYTFWSKGSFAKAGMDFNLLKPDKSLGKYWLGLGLRYGISRFSSEVPFLEKTNYWGTTTTSIDTKSYWGHFFELSPGVRAEVLNHFSIGWSVSIRKLLYTNTGKDLKPVYFPGYGDGTKSVTAAMSYYIVWNIPYKKIKAVLKKETPDEEDDTNNKSTTGTSGNSSNRQQGSAIRQ
jgi:hypothetical protein